MINSIEEKIFIEKQIVKLENILLDLKEKLLPQRQDQFNAMAAVYVRKITELREEIEQYTCMDLLTIQKKDINIHIKGPLIDYGSVPISLISSYLDKFRLSIQKIASSLNDNTKATCAKLKSLTDFRLTDFQPGSINLSLSLPESQLNIFDDEKIEDALKIYFKVLEWLSNTNDKLNLPTKLENKKLEKLLLNILSTLPDDKKISHIEFFGNSIESNKRIYVNYKSRHNLKSFIKKIETIEKLVTIKGNIRELDLDKKTFVLRNIESKDILNKNEKKCQLSDDNVENIGEYLDSRVSVVGVENGNIITVKYIEIL